MGLMDRLQWIAYGGLGWGQSVVFSWGGAAGEAGGAFGYWGGEV